MTQEEAVMTKAEVTREHMELGEKLLRRLASPGWGEADFRVAAQAIADAEARGEARNAAMASRLVEVESALEFLDVEWSATMHTLQADMRPGLIRDLNAENVVSVAKQLGWTSPTQNEGPDGYEPGKSVWSEE